MLSAIFKKEQAAEAARVEKAPVEQVSDTDKTEDKTEPIEFCYLSFSFF